MKNPALVFVLVPMICLACQSKKITPLSEARKQQIVDSIVRVREQEIREMEEENLRDRMSIELKVKTDSLLALRQPAPKAVIPQKDTILPAPAQAAGSPDSTGKQPQ